MKRFIILTKGPKFTEQHGFDDFAKMKAYEAQLGLNPQNAVVCQLSGLQYQPVVFFKDPKAWAIICTSHLIAYLKLYNELLNELPKNNPVLQNFMPCPQLFIGIQN